MLSVLCWRKGSSTAVAGSGSKSMSDSWISWKPRIEEPSKPKPSTKPSSVSSWAGTEKCCISPGRSQKRKSTISTPASFMSATTSAAVRSCTSPPSGQTAPRWAEHASPRLPELRCPTVARLLTVGEQLPQAARPLRRRRAQLEGLSHAEPAGVRASHRRGTRGALCPALVHRRPRHAEVLRHHLGRARERPRRGDDLRRLGHRRLLPGAGVGRPRQTGPEDLPALAGPPRGAEL